MKTLRLFGLLLFVSLLSKQVFAQDASDSQEKQINALRRSSVTVNALPVLAGSFNVFYEKPLQREDRAVSFGVGYADVIPMLAATRITLFSLTGEYKFYMPNSNFYLSPYAKYLAMNRSYETDYPETNYKETINRAGIGTTIGIRHVFNSGFVLQKFIGFGSYYYTQKTATNETAAASRKLSPIDFRIGICVGFAL